MYCWTVTGERQSQRFKLAYVNAILSQEVGWFDEQGASEMSTRVAELCGKVQDGLGRKASDIMQNLAQVWNESLSRFRFVFIICFLPLSDVVHLRLHRCVLPVLASQSSAHCNHPVHRLRWRSTHQCSHFCCQ